MAGVAIDGRAAVRPELGGVERWARELCARLPYAVLAPRPAFSHRAGHAWEQVVLPLRSARHDVLLCPANLAPVAARNVVVILHDAAPLRHPEWYSPLYAAWQRRLLPLIARRARRVITVSPFSARELEGLLGVEADIVYGGVDARFRPDAHGARPGAPPPGGDDRVGAPPPPAGDDRVGAPPPPAGDDRARSGAPTASRAPRPARPYVLCVASHTARKNLAALGPAAAALRELGVDLLVAGGHRPQFAAEAGLTGLTLLGHVPDDDLPALYAGAEAFVLPSVYEGFGLPVLEAMASGTPVVAADTTALPDTAGGAARLVPPEPDALREALTTLVADPAERARLRALGLQRAREFTWDRAASEVDAIVQRAR
ncbi:MAG TPA: glycosyltransferase family 1 protein [Solirubrobacter sp.]|nr:glycosyltransferase family 1 protein [Solirubrobacter sp.]